MYKHFTEYHLKMLTMILCIYFTKNTLKERTLLSRKFNIYLNIELKNSFEAK